MISKNSVDRLKSGRAGLGALSLLGALAIPASVSAQMPGAAAGCPNVDPTLPISVGAEQSDFQKLESRVLLKGSVIIE